MKRIMTIDELNHSIWNEQLNSFLNLLGLESKFISYNMGMVKDKNDAILGKSYILSIINAENNFCIQSNVVHAYGGIRLRLDLNSSKNILCFEINQQKSRCLKGQMVGEKIENQFVTKEFEISTYQKEIEQQKLSLSKFNKVFSYHNYETDEKVSLLKSGQFKTEEQTILSSSFENEDHEKMKLIISDTEDNKRISDINFYNRRTGLSYETAKVEEQINENTKLYEQYETVLNQTDPRFYNRLETMLETYEYNGENIVSTAMKEIILKELTEDQSNCLFGKKLVKNKIQK